MLYVTRTPVFGGKNSVFYLNTFRWTNHWLHSVCNFSVSECAVGSFSRQWKTRSLHLKKLFLKVVPKLLLQKKHNLYRLHVHERNNALINLNTTQLNMCSSYVEYL